VRVRGRLSRLPEFSCDYFSKLRHRWVALPLVTLLILVRCCIAGEYFASLKKAESVRFFLHVA